MKLKTLPCLALLAASFALVAGSAMAAEPTAGPLDAMESVASLSTPAETSADGAPVPDLGLLEPQPEPKAQGCGGPHTLYYAFYLQIQSQAACDAQCTSWCDGLGGRVTTHFWTPRTECDCGCCV